MDNTLNAVKEAVAATNQAKLDVQQQQLNMRYQDLQRKLVDSVSRQRDLIREIRRGHMEHLPAAVGEPLLKVLRHTQKELTIADLKMPRDWWLSKHKIDESLVGEVTNAVDKAARLMPQLQRLVSDTTSRVEYMRQAKMGDRLVMSAAGFTSSRSGSGANSVRSTGSRPSTPMSTQSNIEPRSSKHKKCVCALTPTWRSMKFTCVCL